MTKPMTFFECDIHFRRRGRGGRDAKWNRARRRGRQRAFPAAYRAWPG